MTKVCTKISSNLQYFKIWHDYKIQIQRTTDRGFPQADHSVKSARIVLKQNKLSKKKKI